MLEDMINKKRVTNKYINKLKKIPCPYCGKKP